MEPCVHLQSELCRIASELAGRDVRPHVTACEFCTHKADLPRAINRVTVSIALSECMRSEDIAGANRLKQTYGTLLRTPHEGVSRAEQVRQGHGPGTELHKLLASLGVHEQENCQCLTRALQMNAWGPAGCREHRDEILAWMREGQDRFGWRDKLTAATRAVTTGLAFRLNPLDPFPGILDESIRRAEAQAERTGNVRKDAEFGKLVGPVAQVRPEKLILKCNLCPGDILTLTAAVESLHRTYPGQYLTDVRTPAKEIWHANPHVTTILDSEPGVRVIDMHYPSINRCNQESVPFLGGYTEYLAEQLMRPLRLQTNRPHIYMSAAELAQPPQIDGPYWIVNAGIKRDYTCKAWPIEHYQEVVDRTAGRIRWVQIGLREHEHPPLRGVTSLLDSGPPLRELIRLAYHAQGGLGPVTFLQHLCAAWEKPYVCLVGGREPTTWVQYPYQHTLHTVGQLDCCRPYSCWRARVVPLGDGDEKDKSLCQYPVTEGLVRPSPKCLAMIRPEEVLQILERHA
jgi:ADP-heptose:LPS heptosyltransferase